MNSLAVHYMTEENGAVRYISSWPPEQIPNYRCLYWLAALIGL